MAYTQNYMPSPAVAAPFCSEIFCWHEIVVEFAAPSAGANSRLELFPSSSHPHYPPPVLLPFGFKTVSLASSFPPSLALLVPPSIELKRSCAIALCRGCCCSHLLPQEQCEGGEWRRAAAAAAAPQQLGVQ